MRYYLDTEFDGLTGPLLTMALVREDGESLYLVCDFEPMDIWVRQNVRPILFDCPASPVVSTDRQALAMRVADFLAGDPSPVIVTDWIADVRHFCALMAEGSVWWSMERGPMERLPSFSIEVAAVDAYPTTLAGAVQHNAWWDAMALREKLHAAAA